MSAADQLLCPESRGEFIKHHFHINTSPTTHSLNLPSFLQIGIRVFIIHDPNRDALQMRSMRLDITQQVLNNAKQLVLAPPGIRTKLRAVPMETQLLKCVG